MTVTEKRNAYQQFFLKNEAGREFMSRVAGLIASNHDKAEKEPDLARDYVQRAKGNREIIEHIQSLVADRSRVTMRQSYIQRGE